ncbi:unnamed protein product, partial [Didymodactylos carnosus]
MSDQNNEKTMFNRQIKVLSILISLVLAISSGLVFVCMLYRPLSATLIVEENNQSDIIPHYYNLKFESILNNNQNYDTILCHTAIFFQLIQSRKDFTIDSINQSISQKPMLYFLSTTINNENKPNIPIENSEKLNKLVISIQFDIQQYKIRIKSKTKIFPIGYYLFKVSTNIQFKQSQLKILSQGFQYETWNDDKNYYRLLYTFSFPFGSSMMFPCFNKDHYFSRSIFDISIIGSKQDLILSNMPLKQKIEQKNYIE